MHPLRTSAPSCIVFPPDATHFNFKPGIIQLLPTFHGLDFENPYFHLRYFEEVCNTYHDQNCSKDIIRLKLFPFSLKEKAKTWLQNLRPQSICSWDEMQQKNLNFFFLPIEQILSRGKSPLTHKNLEKPFTNVGSGIRTCLIFAPTMVLKLGE